MKKVRDVTGKVLQKIDIGVLCAAIAASLLVWICVSSENNGKKANDQKEYVVEGASEEPAITEKPIDKHFIELKVKKNAEQAEGIPVDKTVYDIPEPSCVEKIETSAANGVSLDWGGEDDEVLLKIAQAEAGDQDVKGKALVMRVVLNRVMDGAFPGTIPSVVFQKHQFSPVSNGRYYDSIPDSDCRKALDLVKSGWDESMGATYFDIEETYQWHMENLDYLFKYGDHYFFKE